ncbi:MAG: hypothetical protein GXO50_10125 [Chlorobi bacterium]|nr:hypothetical protein [Chlorobiota bacterium]
MVEASNIKQTLIFEGKYKVVLLHDSDIDKGRNVVGLDLTGKIIWRIASDPINSDFSYVSIANKNGRLYVTNFSTNQIEVDYKTGRILSNRWVK